MLAHFFLNWSNVPLGSADVLPVPSVRAQFSTATIVENIPLLLDAFGISKPPSASCLGDPEACPNWPSRSDYVELQLRINLIMEEHNIAAFLPPQRENAPLFLALFFSTACKLSLFIRALFQAIEQATIITEDDLYEEIRLFGGALVAVQCAESETRAQEYANAARQLRRTIIRAKFPQSDATQEHLHTPAFQLLALWDLKNWVMRRFRSGHTLQVHDLIGLPGDYSFVFHGLTLEELKEAGDVICEKQQGFVLPLLHALLVDWKAVTPEQDLVSGKFIRALVKGFLGRGLKVTEAARIEANLNAWKKLSQFAPFKAFCGKTQNAKRKVCSKVLTLRIPSFGDLLVSAVQFKPLGVIAPSVNKGLLDSIATAKRYQATLKKLKLIHHNVGAAPLPLWGIVDGIAKSNLQDSHGILASLTMLFLAKQISFDKLLQEIPTEFNPAVQTLMGMFGDRLLSLISNKAIRSKLEGGWPDDPAALLIVTLRSLYLDTPADCRLPKEKIKNTLQSLLIFHLASLKAKESGFENLNGLLIERMQVGETLLLPTAACRHAMVYTIQRLITNEYRINLFNSGMGTKKLSCGRYGHVRSFKLEGLEELKRRNYLINLYIPYSEFDDYVLGMPIAEDDHSLAKKSIQRSGSCFAKSLLYWLRHELGSDMNWFKTFLFQNQIETIRNALKHNRIQFGYAYFLYTTWGFKLATQPVCLSLLKASDLFTALRRHYVMRLRREVIDDHGSMQRIEKAAADDPDLLKCLESMRSA